MTPQVEVPREELVRALLLVSTAFALAPAGVAVGERWLGRVPVFFARWGFSHALSVALVTLLAVFAAQALLARSGDDVSSLTGLALSVGALGAGAAFAGLTARRLHPEGIGALGLRRGHALGGIGSAVLLYVLCAPALFGLQVLWPWLYERLGGQPEDQRVLVDLLAMGGVSRTLGFALAIVGAPFVEELLFRGFLQPLLVQNFRESGGVVLTSALFALLHGVAFFLPLFALSLILGYARLRSGNLWSSIAVHALHNAITLTLAVTVGLE